MSERSEPFPERGSERAATGTDEATLLAFAKVYLDSNLVTLVANKYLRTGAQPPVYDCWTETRARADGPLERFELIWSPGAPDRDPATGFRAGPDSDPVAGSSTAQAPQDVRTAALLLLVTTKFVYLSANQGAAGLRVRGVIEAAEGGHHYVVLRPSAI